MFLKKGGLFDLIAKKKKVFFKWTIKVKLSNVWLGYFLLELCLGKQKKNYRFSFESIVW